MSCTYTYPSRFNNHDTTVKETFWFAKMNGNEHVDLKTDPEYSSRVQYNCVNNNCNLRITDLRESDSAEYKFRFITNQEGGKYSGSPGVTLTVKDADLQVRVDSLHVYPSELWAVLMCHSSCLLPGPLRYVWYKNGRIIQGQASSYCSDSFTPTDSFSCAVEGHENSRSPPLYPVRVPSVSVSPSAEIVEGSSVTLTCSSDANPAANYTWYKKNGDPDLQPLSKEPQLVFRSIQSSDSGEYYCTAENELWGKMSKYIYINVKLIQGQDDWGVTYSSTEICALKGSTVDMSCTYTYPSTVQRVENRFWFIKESKDVYTDLRTDPEYSGRVQYNFGNNDCTLRITDLRESDSAEYKFRFLTTQPDGKHSGLPGVTLTVKDLQVRVNSLHVYPSELWAELKCHSSCLLRGRLHYVWYKNGQIIQGQTSSYYSVYFTPTDSFSCAVEGHENFRCPPLYPLRVPSVSVSPSAEIVEGSSVTLTCSSDANPAAKYTWYKKNGDPDLHPLSKEPQLVFSSIQSSDSGEYYCTAENDLQRMMSKHISIDVKLIQGQDDWGVTYSSTEICALKGSTVDMSCTYTYPSTVQRVENRFWFIKERNKVYTDLRTDPEYSSRVQYNCVNNSCSLRITDLRESDSAKYKFRFITDQESGKYSGLPGVTLSVKDLQVRVNRLQASTRWAELKCHSSCLPPGRLHYVWYKNGRIIQGQTSSYCSVSFTPTDSFSCAVEGHENFRSPPLYPVRVPSVSVSPSAEIVEGSSVTLTCSSDANPAAKYTWYKNKRNADRQPFSKEPQLHFGSIQSSDSGEYYCTAENELWGKMSKYISIDVKYAPKSATASVSPSAEIVEDSSVTLTCCSDANPAANYTWYKEKQKLLRGQRGIYDFSSISSEDRGNYSCKSENQYGEIMSSSVSVDVQYAPRLPSVSVSPSAEIVEGSSVTLTCSSDANPAAKYTWYKENGDPDLQPLSKEPQLVFSSIQSSDSGEYYCTAENELGRRTSEYIYIDVKYAPKLPSVSVSPSAEIVEGSSVTLTCSSDANPAANYTWYKKNGDPDRHPLSKEPQLVFSSIQSSDSGEYYCTAENELGSRTSEYISIDVTYAPKLPSVSVSPSAEIVEGSSVTLTCSSDANPAAKYTWYKKNGDPDLHPLSKEPQLVFSSIQCI
uniref:B-cell receptor CD22 n=1 Tax=Sparus aurata TaxID=8175 RepID=A0A671TGY6_SPAAU